MLLLFVRVRFAIALMPAYLGCALMLAAQVPDKYIEKNTMPGGEVMKVTHLGNDVTRLLQGKQIRHVPVDRGCAACAVTAQVAE